VLADDGAGLTPENFDNERVKYGKVQHPTQQTPGSGDTNSEGAIKRHIEISGAALCLFAGRVGSPV
jgi:hypothetical protein